MPAIQTDNAGIVFRCLLTLMFLGEAWVNIVNKKVSRFSIDGLLAFMLKKFGPEKFKQNVSNFPRNKTEIIILGCCALLAGLRGVYDILIALKVLVL